MRVLENITFDELQIGDYATFTKTLSEENLVLFAATTGNLAVSSLNVESAEKVLHDDKIGFGSWCYSLISAAFDKVIPGPGSVCLKQDLNFSGKVNLGDTLTVKLTVNEKRDHHHVVFLSEVKNQEGSVLANGEALVLAPVDKITVEESLYHSNPAPK